MGVQGKSNEGTIRLIRTKLSDFPLLLIVFDMILSPRQVIFQQALSLRMLPESKVPMEFRVDCVRGVPIMANLRYRWVFDYYPSEAKAAMQYIAAFFARAPFDLQLTCGLDVAQKTDGSWTIIEFNPGMQSGFLSEGVNWNHFLSCLLGRPTPLIEALNQLTDPSVATVEAQAELFRRTQRGESIFTHAQVSHGEYYLRSWFRDSCCNQLAAQPSYPEAIAMMNRLEKVFGIMTRKKIVSRRESSDLADLDRELPPTLGASSNQDSASLVVAASQFCRRLLSSH
jgi:hypothetical protein